MNVKGNGNGFAEPSGSKDRFAKSSRFSKSSYKEHAQNKFTFYMASFVIILRCSSLW